MKLKSILVLIILLLSARAGIAQTKHTAINEAWSKLKNAYLLRNANMLMITDTLLNREAIGREDYSELSGKVDTLTDALGSVDSLNKKQVADIEVKNQAVEHTFGKLALISGMKFPGHYYLDQLEGLENRIQLYKRKFNDACKANKRKDLLMPLEPAPKVKF